jgi:hypothetical protein
MRSLARAAPILAVAVAAGCGGTSPGGAAASKVIKGDWDGAYAAGSNPFPSRPDLKGYSTIDSISCQAHPDAHRHVRCALVVSNGEKRSRRIGVVATYDSDGILTQWVFA